MKVLLHDNQICERGTTTSVLSYGRALRERGHDVEISYWSESPANVPALVDSVGREFHLLPHRQRFALELGTSPFDAAYFIKSGERDGLDLTDTRTLIHAVFQNYDPHGSRYAYISQWLASSMREQVSGRRGRRNGLATRGLEALEEGCSNALDFDALDLIVDIPEPQDGIRQELGIPEDAFVILRFGGYDSFDIEWAQQAVVRLLDEHRDWYFIGLNTSPFTAHERARFIPMVMDPVEKASLVGAANVFLTARGQGEAFGVAIAEALQIGVPVLAWNGGTDRNHIQMLDGLDALFRNPRDLRRRLQGLARGQDPASVTQRQQRGNAFRPDVVTPHLEQLLGVSD